MGSNCCSYEWNEDKRETNLKKHGIDFVDALKVLEGQKLTLRSERNDEARFLSVGRLDGRFVVVIYVIRNDAYRIISARRARDGEIRAYHESYPGGGPGA